MVYENSNMMKMIHVTVMVRDIVWDQFLISQDHILFITFKNQCCNNDTTHLELIESIKSNESMQCKGDALIKSNNNNNIQHINEQDIMEKVNKLDISSHVEGDTDTLQKNRKSKCIQKLYINGYLLSLFVTTVRQSAVYRRNVVANFKDCTKQMDTISCPSGIVKVNMKLVCPHKDIIDFVWNECLGRMVLEKRELDNAMSWLSTLGGAFSALGEEFKHCAEIAGRISVQQFSIALRLGDPLTVSRCKLYLALSLVQRRRLVPARHIIEQQYRLAHSALVVDTRLISMCLGIWAKLKYEHHKRKTERRRKK